MGQGSFLWRGTGLGPFFWPRMGPGPKNFARIHLGVLQKWSGMGPGLPKHPRVEPRAGPDLDLTHPY